MRYTLFLYLIIFSFALIGCGNKEKKENGTNDNMQYDEKIETKKSIVDSNSEKIETKKSTVDNNSEKIASLKLDLSSISKIRNLIKIRINEEIGAGGVNQKEIQELTIIDKILDVCVRNYYRNEEISEYVNEAIAIAWEKDKSFVEDDLEFDKDIVIGPNRKQDLMAELHNIALKYGYKQSSDPITSSMYKKLTTVGFCKELVKSKIKDIEK